MLAISNLRHKKELLLNPFGWVLQQPHFYGLKSENV